MDGLSLQTAEKRTQEQRRCLMYLVVEFLRQQGFYKSCDSLVEEAQLTKNYEICDNIDLEIIFNEYNDFYHARFNKLPQICKRVVANQVPASKDSCEASSNNKDNKKKTPIKIPLQLESKQNCPNESGLLVTPLSQKNSISSKQHSEEFNGLFGNEKTLRPLGNLYPEGSEWREIAEIITREIVMTNLNVHWEDICGLDECKELLREAVVYPAKYPETFNALFTPWKGILLHGPAGTGKTMLAKAVATECDLTFFNITASSLVSKWRGDSEKYIRVLFELASHHAPSIIFIDEIDWISGDGTSASDRSEPARRFRAELLSRLDGLMSEDTNSRIILLAATNAPWNLDSALLRRLEHHVKVEVPDLEDRKEFLELYTDESLHGKIHQIAYKAEGYSYADLKRLCKDAWMEQMRPIWSQLERGVLKKNDSTIKKPLLIRELVFLRRSIEHILCTARNLRDKYEKWETDLTPGHIHQ